MTTIGSALEHSGNNFPDRIAVLDGDDCFSFRELRERCRRTADALHGLGVGPGDRVAIIARNSHYYVELLIAVPAAGMVIVPLNHRLSLHELRQILADCDPKVLFTDSAIVDPEELSNTVETVVELGPSWESALAGASELAPEASVDEGDAAAIFYTGGTTAKSKGVIASHRNKITEAIHLSLLCRITSDDVWLVQAPMFHASGAFNLIACLWAGATQVLAPGFDAELSLSLIESHGVTLSFGVPSMLTALIEMHEKLRTDISTLRLIGYGGAPMTVRDQRLLHDRWPEVEMLSMYGSTEMASIATGVVHHERHLDDSRAGSCGQPAALIDLRVVDPETGLILGAGEIGELQVKGPNVMLGYWRNDKQTTEAMQDGYFRTGDLGYVDPVGFVFIVDRLKDMIISGGENVYSSEVEAALASHEDVLEAAVIGVPDRRWGEAVHAIVRLRPSAQTRPEALQAHCRGILAGYKVPKSIDVTREPLPRTPAGKLIKAQLRQSAADS